MMPASLTNCRLFIMERNVKFLQKHDCKYLYMGIMAHVYLQVRKEAFI